MTYHTIYKKGFVASFETYPNGRTSYIITREGGCDILDWAQGVISKERAIALVRARIEQRVASEGKWGRAPTFFDRVCAILGGRGFTGDEPATEVYDAVEEALSCLTTTTTTYRAFNARSVVLKVHGAQAKHFTEASA